jgi:hypothetical protein
MRPNAEGRPEETAPAGEEMSAHALLELRQELMAVRKWELANFTCSTQTEIDAVAHRILRVSELLRQVREIAQRN